MPAFLERSRRPLPPGLLDLSGFTVYTLLRGFENSMADFLVEPERAERLLDMICDFECELMALAARHGFHGIHFADDWGTQTGLMVSPQLWRRMFKPRYARQFALAHGLGLHVWYHCCGNFAEIAPDFHEIGVDVLNISQPNVLDIAAVGAAAARQAVLHDADQLPDRVASAARRRRSTPRPAGSTICWPATRGGFIGYVEEYGCMGMSAENYRACGAAFRALSSG